MTQGTLGPKYEPWFIFGYPEAATVATRRTASPLRSAASARSNTLYLRFPSKDALLPVLLERYEATLFADLNELMWWLPWLDTRGRHHSRTTTPVFRSHGHHRNNGHDIRMATVSFIKAMTTESKFM